MANSKIKKLINPILIIIGYIVLMVAFWLILKHFKLDDIETLQNICSNSFVGYFVFILLQIVQVVFLPINSIIFTIPAIIIFGPLKAFLVSYIGLILGSIIMFFIGRLGGVKLLNLLVGDTKAKHYAKMLGKGKFLFPIFMLVGLFPDDLLCVSAGISNIKFSYFFAVVLITRAIDLAFTCFVSVFAIKSPLGIAFLAIFFVVFIILAFVLTKKQDKIEHWFVNALAKKNKG